ncbi:hypothetical protein CERZMDRAFT_91165 [Cercospora zeae-maydis SCOH1-5]|uniref:Uncharacterized protein n=1 Tax=Cercospora zeae-maydis SCOH1-5 TaxID=717836 RepID=A0A6A6FAG4_9PEZI|nr:hypothetical protein CERZMDRAFT_91165 [Cercospora zeae-maydis SCOH1-5]
MSSVASEKNLGVTVLATNAAQRLGLGRRIGIIQLNTKKWLNCKNSTTSLGLGILTLCGGCHIVRPKVERSRFRDLKVTTHNCQALLVASNHQRARRQTRQDAGSCR